jgi:hypothetical protein
LLGTKPLFFLNHFVQAKEATHRVYNAITTESLVS